MTRISGAKSLAVAFAAACLACSSAAFVHAAPAGDSDQQTTVVTTTAASPTTKKRSPFDDFEGREPVEIAPELPDSTTDETSTTDRPVPSTTDETSAPAIAKPPHAEMPEAFLPPDSTTPDAAAPNPSDTETTTPSLTTTPSPTTTAPAPSSKADSESGAISNGGPDEPSGYFVGGLVPVHPVHHNAPTGRYRPPDLAATANPRVAAVGVAALGAMGMVAGLIAYRGALVSHQRRAAARAALFGANGGIG